MINYHNWSKYHPDEVQSREHESFIDAAAFKIVDVYTAFCYFDCSLRFFRSKNYGELSTNITEENQLFFKSMFVFNALFYINSCKDYILQLIYCFCQNHSEKMYDHEVLEKEFENSDMSNLVEEKLKVLIALASVEKDKLETILSLKRDVENYFNNKYLITYKCNYIKHRGMFHIPGMGQNNKTAFEHFGITARFIPTEGEPHSCKPKKTDLSRRIGYC